jgi:hypothetical protein
MIRSFEYTFSVTDPGTNVSRVSAQSDTDRLPSYSDAKLIVAAQSVTHICMVRTDSLEFFYSWFFSFTSGTVKDSRPAADCCTTVLYPVDGSCDFLLHVVKR